MAHISWSVYFTGMLLCRLFYGWLVVLSVLTGKLCHAQGREPGYQKIGDLQDAQPGDTALHKISRNSVRNSSFMLLNIADSLSGRGDSIGAGKCMLQIAPYYFLWFNVTPQGIDTFSHLRLTQHDRQAVKRKFTAVYTAAKPEAFRNFRKLFDEDQDIRLHAIDRNADSAGWLLWQHKMAAVDTPHFRYLHNYVARNGWPTIRNGSLYAQILLRHNPGDWRYCLPALKTAVLRGDADYTLYNDIVEKLTHKPYLEMLDAHKNKVVFDISSVLHLQRPPQMNELLNAVKAHSQY